MKQAWDVSVIQAGKKIRGPPRVPTSAELKFYETYLIEAKKISNAKIIFSRRNSGANSLSLSLKMRSNVLPCVEIKEDMNIFASITNSI